MQVRLSIDLDNELSLNDTNLFDCSIVWVTSGTGTPFQSDHPTTVGRNPVPLH